MTDDTHGEPVQVRVQRRVVPAAVTLLVVNIINLLLAGLVLFVAWVYCRMDDDQFQRFIKEAWDNLDPKDKQTLVKEGWNMRTFAEFMRMVFQCLAVGMGVSIFFSLLAIVGAIGMLSLRWRGLAITGSIATAIPGLNTLSCLLIGEVVGIWCLVVLFNRETTAVFAGYRGTPDEPPETPPEDAWPMNPGEGGFRE
jgi:hypothetical protein